METPKRFVIQQEQFAQDRITAIRESLGELKKEYPEIISLTLFGSLTKGKSREESDIDATVFIDVDMLAKQNSGEKAYEFITKEEIHKDVEITMVTINTYLTNNFYQKYNQLFQEKMKEKIPSLKEDHVEHIRSLPMSKSELNELLDMVIDSKKREKEYEDRVFAKNPKITSFGEFKEAMAGVEKPEKLIVTPTLPLGSMFFLEVGKGLYAYRKLLIERLIQEGEIGKRIWDDIMNYVERWEQSISSSEVPTDVHYPRTLEKAREVYL